MSDVVIRVEGLGKQYRLGATSGGYKTIRESLTDVAMAPIRSGARILQKQRSDLQTRGPDRFWALDDVNFSVCRGETVGVIGRNGAGKSTLLKLLSQITEPTRGRIAVRGRTAALLEVGTGFHPELSGRENIFLNGAILGMPRNEILRKFDQIVNFAEVEKFVDTPVKHYSSGMYLRLAFAVAAHLEPDILIVDEVLAVGDASFQKKCLNKMEDVGNEGRTVLFVSHDMSAITRLCRRSILLGAGRKVHDGPAHQVVSEYLRSGLGTTSVREWQDIRRAPGDEVMRLRRVRVCSEDGLTIETVDIRRPFGIEVVFEVLEPDHALTPNLHLFNEEGVCVFVSSDMNSDWRSRPRPVGEHVSTMWVPGNFLAEGGFTVRAAVSTMDPLQVHADEVDAVAFHVVDTLEGDSARGDFAGPMPGVVRPLLLWTDEVSAEKSVLSVPAGVLGP
jgi:lipopolysaccharide transport system ATP-binding protein